MKARISITRYAILAVAVIVAVAGCDSPEPGASTQAASIVPTKEPKPQRPRKAKVPPAEKPSFTYSPFYVELEGEGEFELITFKDVGLDRGTTDPNDPMLEVIAESVSYAIANSSLGYGRATVGYDEGLSKPEAHRACGRNHLYVDVWKNDDGAYGYSLWSGCSEADNFAWHQLVEPAGGGSLADEVEPLTESIIASIAEAKEKQCFTKHC